MFGFKKKNKANYRDLIWMTKEIKTIQLLSLPDDGKPVFIISSFEETLKQIMSLDPAMRKMESLSDFDNSRGPWLVNSKLILNASTHQQIGAAEVRIAFTEHYPMPEKDSEIISKTAAVFKNPEISFYISLEDPLLRLFNSGKIADMMRAMGIDENEAIEHRMISSALVNAQKKLAKTIRIEKKYDDEEAWYRMNYRG